MQAMLILSSLRLEHKKQRKKVQNYQMVVPAQAIAVGILWPRQSIKEFIPVRLILIKGKMRMRCWAWAFDLDADDADADAENDIVCVTIVLRVNRALCQPVNVRSLNNNIMQVQIQIQIQLSLYWATLQCIAIQYIKYKI